MNRFHRSVYLARYLVILLALAYPAQTFSQEMPVPTGLQVLLFKKIFSYDKLLANASDINILVAYTDSTVRMKDEVMIAFQKAGVSAIAKKPEQIVGSLAGISAIYIIDDSDSVRSVCRERKILSITGIPALVKNGETAVGLDVSDNKPKILVHMEELKSVGHELSAKLLQLADVI